MTQQSPSDEHSETYKALRAGYYHLLEKLYEKLLDSDGDQQKIPQKDVVLLIETETDEDEQGHEIREAMKADLEHLEERMRKGGSEAREDWLKEWHDIESDWAAKLLTIADRTDVELAAMREEAERHQPREWNAGHFTSPKRLRCVECGEVVNHRDFGPVKPCPKCGGKSFQLA